jgi:alkylated DNA repair dioxygenase AlkB
MPPQPMLFDDVTRELPGGVTYYPNFIDPDEADRLFAALLALKWEQHVYRGRNQPAPREYAWMGIPYVSPNLVNKIVVTPWTPEAKALKTRVEEQTRCTFDSLNLNKYRNHRDSIDWHSDGEKEGLWNFPIASVSLGAVRAFRWRNNSTRVITTQPLAHGSLLVMPRGFQRDHQHALPKQDEACGPRINLTFRRRIAQ